jgi:hypothetical protein
LDKEGKATVLASCVNSKGIVGSDSRKYFLDLVRVTPRDANFPDPTTHSTCLLRPELIQQFCRHKALGEVVAAHQAKEEAKAAKGEVSTTKAAAEEDSEEAAKEVMPALLILLTLLFLLATPTILTRPTPIIPCRRKRQRRRKRRRRRKRTWRA